MLQNRGRFLSSVMGGCHAPILIGCEIQAWKTELNPHQVLWPATSLIKTSLRHCHVKRQASGYRPRLSYQLILSPTTSSKSIMPASIANVIPIYLTIAYTVDTLLSTFHPFIPWLVMRQSDRTPLRMGYTIGFEHVHGVPFRDQKSPMFGHISAISHFVQGFVIVMVSMDPQSFKTFHSTIYLAIPRSWIILPLLPSIKYRLAYRSLSAPRFLHLLDPTHGVYQSVRLEDRQEGSRMIQEV